MYLSHINSRLQTNLGAYSSTGCTPNSSLCSTSAIVICQSSRYEARIGGKQCLKNLTLSNGLVTYPSGVIFPSQALYDCNAGYRNTGASYGDCNTLGNWDKAKGNCQALNCQAPGILNGQMMGAPPMFQPVCFDGFTRVGPDMVYCSRDTNTTQLPNCTAYSGKCAASTLDNGYIKEGGDGLAVRELFCNAGYRLHTSANYTCVSATISKRIVSCKKLVCNSSTVVIENGHLLPAEGVINEQARVLCNKGFSMAGSGIATCEVSGTWKSNSTCKGDSCAAPTIPNSNISGIQATTGELHYVGCEDGYNLEGNATIECSAPDLWTPFPHCTPVTCGALPTVPHGSVIVGHTEATAGTFATVICDPKYELHGNRTLVCEKNGSWATNGQTCNETTSSTVSNPYCQATTESVYIGIMGALGALLVILLVVVVCLTACSRNAGQATISGDSGTSLENLGRTKVEVNAPGSAKNLPADQDREYGTIGDSCSAEASHDDEHLGEAETNPQLYSNHSAINTTQITPKESLTAPEIPRFQAASHDVDVYTNVGSPAAKTSADFLVQHDDVNAYLYAAVKTTKPAPTDSDILDDIDAIQFPEPQKPKGQSHGARSKPGGL
ncbi:sushi, von Willebrand factor type A, EGF and pentraxin domain-containing protein 1-like [Sycon ciliatum]|uniref:sushi, von Willebrand factor type A, EGF and pentraxin domain-containing protein 1-like n=1 Tax=Sycon ciliatum TaxID=27933 RepID=UPI0031F64295